MKDKLLVFRPDNAYLVIAEGQEFVRTMVDFKGIPYRHSGSIGANRQRWYGDMAKFIAGNWSY